MKLRMTKQSEKIETGEKGNKQETTLHKMK